MKTIIHNLDDINFLEKSNNRLIRSKDVKHCIGCFKCWTNNDTCFIKDKVSNNSKILLKSDELIIISKCINGCYESSIKKVLERSISYVEPYFVIINKEIHHKPKTDKKNKLSVYFYGNNITETDKKIAIQLVKRNAINLHADKPTIEFINTYKEIKL